MAESDTIHIVEDIAVRLVTVWHQAAGPSLTVFCCRIFGRSASMPPQPAIFFPGRLDSDPAFGNVYRIDALGNLDIVVPGLAGTGIALDAAGNYYVTTRGSDQTGFLGRSLYRIDPLSLDTVLLATFDESPQELSIDDSGNIYVMGRSTSDILRLTAVPLPPALILLASGLALTGTGFRRGKTH